MRKFFIVFLLVFSFLTVKASDTAKVNNDTLSTNESHAKEKFNTTEFIFEHIGDSFEWHILTVNHHHISIPLPIILYSKAKGFNIFLSNKFHNPNHEYMGFKLETEGDYKGKIVEVGEDVNGKRILPLNFSLTKNALTILMVSGLLCWVFISIGRKYKANPESAPSGIQNLFEPIILFIRNEVAIPSIGEKKYIKYMPYLLTVFFFIWFTNMLGLIPIFPGGANVTGNIAVTMVLALFTFFVVNLNANKHYWIEFINPPGVPWFLKFPIPIMPIVEITGLITKPIVLMIRLFANILAGHMVAIVFMSLIFIFAAIKLWLGFVAAPISLIFSIFMSLLELLVALIQAYVFTLLSAIYIGMATADHH